MWFLASADSYDSTDGVQPVKPSLVSSPMFAELAPYIRIETYARDGGHQHPRKRIELAAHAPPQVVASALALQMPCVACGSIMHPFRQRSAASKRSHHAHVYFAAACPLDVNVGCSRGHEARDEYLRVVEAVRCTVPAAEAQLTLVLEEKNKMDEAVVEKKESAEMAAMRLSAGAGIFDESAMPGSAQDREDQLMGALVVLRSDVDTLRGRVNALSLALAIVIVVLLGATYVVLR